MCIFCGKNMITSSSATQLFRISWAVKKVFTQKIRRGWEK